MKKFVTADSGDRMEFESGMKRDTAEGKTNWLLVRPGPMLKRWADLLTRGSEKYEREREPGELRNWQRAEGVAELERFLESADRHMAQYLTNKLAELRGEPITPDGFEEDGTPIFEDHAAGVFFNINGAEYVTERLLREPPIVLSTFECRLETKGPATQKVCDTYCLGRCIAP